MKYLLFLLLSTRLLAQTQVQVGQSVSLSVTADGTAPFTYTWTKDGSPVVATTSAYSFTATPADSGSYKVTVSNSAGMASTPAAVIAVIPVPPPAPGAPVSIWGTPTPALVDAGADSSVELGVQFKSDVDGVITGLRFYKAKANVGTHTGTLWSAAGTLIATATFTAETASGWQTVKFSIPVPIAANTIYTASYHVASGHYSADQGYFSKATDAPPLHAPPLHALKGTYAYGTKPAYPTQTWNNSNYWIDVIFSPNLPPPVIAPRIISFTAEIK